MKNKFQGMQEVCNEWRYNPKLKKWFHEDSDDYNILESARMKCKSLKSFKRKLRLAPIGIIFIYTDYKYRTFECRGKNLEYVEILEQNPIFKSYEKMKKLYFAIHGKELTNSEIPAFRYKYVLMKINISSLFCFPKFTFDIINEEYPKGIISYLDYKWKPIGLKISNPNYVTFKEVIPFGVLQNSSLIEEK